MNEDGETAEEVAASAARRERMAKAAALKAALEHAAHRPGAALQRLLEHPLERPLRFR